jgi:hypothetical protein
MLCCWQFCCARNNTRSLMQAECLCASQPTGIQDCHAGHLEYAKFLCVQLSELSARFDDWEPSMWWQWVLPALTSMLFVEQHRPAQYTVLSQLPSCCSHHADVWYPQRCLQASVIGRLACCVASSYTAPESTHTARSSIRSTAALENKPHVNQNCHNMHAYLRYVKVF